MRQLSKNYRTGSTSDTCGNITSCVCQTHPHLNPPLEGEKTLFIPLLQGEGGAISYKSSEGGFALVSMIVAIVIFSILGVALVKISSSSIFSQVGSNSSMKAYYLAEGGYRYAGSKFLHATASLSNYTSERARDDMLSTLHGTTSNLANSYGSFSLQNYPWFYKSSSTGSNTTTLKTLVNGAISSDLTIPASGKISVDGIVYSYSTITQGASPLSVTFNNISPAFAAVPADKTTVLPVAVSTAASQTFANNGDLTLASGASAFPLLGGTFKIGTDFYRYACKADNLGNCSKAGTNLHNVTYLDPLASITSVSVPANTNVTLLKYLELHSTGTVGSGIMATSREVNYRGPIASVSTNQGGGGGPTNVIPPDSFNSPGNPNWLPNNNPLVHGEAAIDTTNVPGGGTALGITQVSGSDHFVMPASSLISNALRERWSWANGLSYDAQVKIAFNSTISYAGGMYFRRHPSGSGTNTSFGLSIVYLKDYNDDNTDVYADKYPATTSPPSSSSSADHSSNSCYNNKNSDNCILAVNTPYLVLWKDTTTGPSGFKTIAYYQLPANYPLNSPYWPTLMVRIKEKPSGSSYCSSFSTTRVNEIQVYYSTNSSGSGDSTAINTTILGNLRGAVNWPPDTGGTNSSNDFFRLVGWHTDYTPSTGTGPGWTSGSYQFGNPGDGPNTVICTTDNLTNIAVYGNSGGPANPFPPEVALAAMGNNIQQHMWFDDFAIGSGPSAGGGVSTIGFLPPVQQ